MLWFLWGIVDALLAPVTYTLLRPFLARATVPILVTALSALAAATLVWLIGFTSPAFGIGAGERGMTQVVWGALWIGVYLVLVAAPLFVLLVAPTPAGLGFWSDFSLTLGFAGTAMMGVQFVLTARFRRATAPYGIDIIYYFHRYLAVVAAVLIVAHPLILFVDDPVSLHLLNPLEARCT